MPTCIAVGMASGPSAMLVLWDTETVAMENSLTSTPLSPILTVKLGDGLVSPVSISTSLLAGQASGSHSQESGHVWKSGYGQSRKQ